MHRVRARVPRLEPQMLPICSVIPAIDARAGPHMRDTPMPDQVLITAGRTWAKRGPSLAAGALFAAMAPG